MADERPLTEGLELFDTGVEVSILIHSSLDSQGNGWHGMADEHLLTKCCDLWDMCM